MGNEKVIRITPKPGNQNLNIDLEQDFDYLEVLSLKILQKDTYRIFCSDKGVLVGKVTSNGGFPLSNAKISLFIPLDDEDSNNTKVTSLYPFKTPQDTLPNGKRYNLLPRDEQINTPVEHVPVGTFPSKYDVMVDKNIRYVYEKYYKYTTITNENGDYMFFGVPTGQYTIHLDVDLSDIGANSITPTDLINVGYSENLFNGDKFRESNDLDQLPQVVGQNKTVYISPFWGDIDSCDFGLSRVDFTTARYVSPKSYLVGSIYTDGKVDGTTTDNFVPSSCWQTTMEGNTNGVGNRAGVSRVVRSGDLRTPRQVANDGENVGHSGIIEAIRLDESGFPEFVGRYVTDINGGFVIPLPLNLGKKVWDENLQGWRDDENGVATYGDYRFKIYFEGQSDTSAGGSRGQIQTGSKTNRGVLFVPNTQYGSIDFEQNTLSVENSYTFYAEPSYLSFSSYQFNVKDQFGNSIGKYTNYTRLRVGSFFSVGQSFNYKSDYDSAIQDLVGTPTTGGIDNYGGWYVATSSFYNGLSGFAPDLVNGSIGANPWIISRSFNGDDQVEMSDVSKRSEFPINYVFNNTYYRRCPGKQDVITDGNVKEYGGYISNYYGDRRVEMSYLGVGYTEFNATLTEPDGTDTVGGSSENTLLDHCGGSTASNGRCLDDHTTSTSSTWYNSSGINCDGCLTLWASASNSNDQYMGAINNPDATPYYDGVYNGGASTSGYDINVNNSKIYGNTIKGGFLSPVAGVYTLECKLGVTTKNTLTAYSNPTPGDRAKWLGVGLSFCDAVTTNCDTDSNWTYSGGTTIYGKVPPIDELIDGDWVDFNGYAGTQPVTLSILGLLNSSSSEGSVIWENIFLSEGMGVRLSVLPLNSNSDTDPNAGGLNSAAIGVCYNCLGGSSTRVITTFQVHRNSREISELDSNRTIKEPLVGSLYFPQYFVDEDESYDTGERPLGGSCCSASNVIPEQGWNHPINTISEKARRNNWFNYSLLYAGQVVSNNAMETRYYTDSYGDPLGGTPIHNGKYYTLQTIGGTSIVEITKDLPNFKDGINQWSSIDKDLPTTSAVGGYDDFTTNNTDYSVFDTNGDGTGQQYNQKKYFTPYDNLLFRVGQQWPRDEGEDGTTILAEESAIPMWYSWTLGSWNIPSNWIYPTNLNNPTNNYSISNHNIYTSVPSSLSEDPGWREWVRRVPHGWYGNNTFWWDNVVPTETILDNGVVTSPWGLGSSFNNDMGASNIDFNAYPIRRYYLFGLYNNLNPIDKVKKLLGYNTNLY